MLSAPYGSTNAITKILKLFFFKTKPFLCNIANDADDLVNTIGWCERGVKDSISVHYQDTTAFTRHKCNKFNPHHRDIIHQRCYQLSYFYNICWRLEVQLWGHIDHLKVEYFVCSSYCFNSISVRCVPTGEVALCRCYTYSIVLPVCLTKEVSL